MGARGALERLLGPLARKDRGLEELLRAVLLVDEPLLKVGGRDRREEKRRRGSELSLGVLGVVNEGLGLYSMHVSRGAFGVKTGTPTQSPPSILRARYMPTAAIMLGLARRKRWSSSVTSMRNLDSVLVWMS